MEKFENVMKLQVRFLLRPEDFASSRFPVTWENSGSVPWDSCSEIRCPGTSVLMEPSPLDSYSVYVLGTTLIKEPTPGTSVMRVLVPEVIATTEPTSSETI
jgi:hypothetical protein